MKNISVVVMCAFLLLPLPAKTQSQITINEVFFDPYGIKGDWDANGDRTYDYHSDEFIELINNGSSNVDISGWTISNGNGTNGTVVFTFPNNIILKSGEICLVFGGINPYSGFANHFPPGLQIFASQLGMKKGFEGGGSNDLSSSNENVILRDAVGHDIAEVYWGSATAMTSVGEKFAYPYTIDGYSYYSTSTNQSITREPDGTGLWSKHTKVGCKAYFSPGVLNTVDLQRPTIMITSPTSGTKIVTSMVSLDLSGIVSDNVGITEITWLNNHGGSGTAMGTTNWHIKGITLHEGINIFTVTVRDSSNNSRQDVLTVTYDSTAVSEIKTEGYYKDVFMDGGVNLTSRKTLPATSALGLSMEYIATSDSLIQHSVMISNDNDENGVLLYPDNEPRFRVIYTNGGTASKHGNSLGEAGRERVRTFYYNGGSYTGSCAGMFIASNIHDAWGIREAYYHIWPGITAESFLKKTYTGHFITANSPLLDYFDFGGDMYIDNVYHNGGGYAQETINYPPQTEVLLRYDYSSLAMHNKPSCWANKGSDFEGRVCVIGSHPEGITSGERLQLMEAILHYAIDGRGNVMVKSVLTNGETRTMSKSTRDNDPAFTKIGDKQNHHFKVNIPEGANKLTVILDGEDGYDLNLYLKNGKFAFNSNADYKDITSGADKNLSTSNVSSGTWYIGVECATTVTATEQNWGYAYSENLGVLNGTAYSIKAEWDPASSINTDDFSQQIPAKFTLGQNYPNPFNMKTTFHFNMKNLDIVRISIFNLYGQLVKKLIKEYRNAGKHQIDWDGTNENGKVVSSGMYFYRMETTNYTAIRRALLMR